VGHCVLSWPDYESFAFECTVGHRYRAGGKRSQPAPPPGSLPVSPYNLKIERNGSAGIDGKGLSSQTAPPGQYHCFPHRVYSPVSTW